MQSYSASEILELVRAGKTVERQPIPPDDPPIQNYWVGDMANLLNLADELAYDLGSGYSFLVDASRRTRRLDVSFRTRDMAQAFVQCARALGYGSLESENEVQEVSCEQFEVSLPIDIDQVREGEFRVDMEWK